MNQPLAAGQGSCLIEDVGLEVPVVVRECLGKCEQEPVMRIAPGGRFLIEIDENRLPDIIDELKAFIDYHD